MQLLPLMRLVKNIKFAHARRSHRGSRSIIVHRSFCLRVGEVPTNRFVSAHLTFLIEFCRTASCWSRIRNNRLFGWHNRRRNQLGCLKNHNGQRYYNLRLVAETSERQLRVSVLAHWLNYKVYGPQLTANGRGRQQLDTVSIKAFIWRTLG